MPYADFRLRVEGSAERNISAWSSVPHTMVYVPAFLVELGQLLHKLIILRGALEGGLAPGSDDF